MTAQALARLALQSGWKPEAWHQRLADMLSGRLLMDIGAAAVVHNIFRHAHVTDIGGMGVLMEFDDAYLRACARPYADAVTLAMGVNVIMPGEMPRPQDAERSKTTELEERDAAIERHIARKKQTERMRSGKWG